MNHQRVDVMMRYTWTAAAGVLAVLVTISVICVSPAAAHRVTVFAWVDGDTVHTESKFSGGKKVHNGQVVVTDLEGSRLMEGRTDENGAYSFKIPKPTAMRIELIAGMGHRGEWVITAEEVGASGITAPEGDRPPGADVPSRGSDAPSPASALGPDDIERIVDAALDRKLEPMMRQIAESRPSGPSISDIIGGIGYILGIVGLATYVHYRKQSRDRST